MRKRGIAGIIDVETTGLSYQNDEIIELGLLLFTYQRGNWEVDEVIGEYSGLREPSCPTSPAAFGVHGIAGKNFKGRELDYLKIQSWIDQCDFLVAHNANFDRHFLAKALPAMPRIHWFCSMRGINWYAKGFRSRALQALLLEHGVTGFDGHRALADVRAVLMLLTQKNSTGQTYLGELTGRYYHQLALN